MIADDNPEISDILNNFLSIFGDIEVCGNAKNGTQALAMIYEEEPDVVLLDIIMPELDGISILSRLKQKPPIKVPSIIMVSAIGQENIANEAFALGACYYIIKPFNMEALLERIRASARNDAAPIKTPSFSDNSLVNRIKKVVIDMGISTNVLGYRYIVMALCILCEADEAVPMTKGIYAAVAEKFTTTIECVEKAIRSAIGSADKRRTPQYVQLFCTDGADQPVKCGNAGFLTKLCEEIKFAA